MVRAIDVMHLERDRVIAAHVVRGELIVDPGPASALANWLGRLEVEPRALLLTHIHLDHAGGAGALVRRFPDLRVYVSEIGAPHLIDPARLLRSAARLYGPQNMERLWGEVVPVPESNVVALSGGEEVEGFRVERTPGHAEHHLVWLDAETGDAFVGDMAGVRIPPANFTLPPTPPPEVDVEAWLRSLELIATLRPSRLHLTHFGAAEDVEAQLERVRARLRAHAELAREGDRERFMAAVAAAVDGAGGEDVVARLRQAAPQEQLWLGLARYWRKRGEG